MYRKVHKLTLKTANFVDYSHLRPQRSEYNHQLSDKTTLHTKSMYHKPSVTIGKVSLLLEKYTSIISGNKPEILEIEAN